MKREFKRLLREVVEEKYHDTYYDAIPALGDYLTCSGDMFSLTGTMIQGSTDTRRVGVEINIHRIELFWSITWPNGVQPNPSIFFRQIVLVYHDDENLLTVGDVLTVNPPETFQQTSNYQAFFQHDKQVKFTVLYDEILSGYACLSGGGVISLDKPLDYKFATMDDLDITVHFRQGAGFQRAMNQIIVLIINDCEDTIVGAAKSWNANFKWRLYYTDV